ncbi:uncharacterized protein LOC113322165 isoform X2 [Papaver somniferum]|uniref:uncharacterized protein LOC113322165 isoform X2 n=1 Tax=Papaver somniferum TaxID=3469 RepID=UPI000E703698|nr:uncharacterized protein LOC113322165 isoform X2 [Papaver somniferum]
MIDSEQSIGISTMHIQVLVELISVLLIYHYRLASSENAYVLAGHDIKWIPRPCYQLHIDVVSAPNRGYNLQPCRITE